MSREAFFEAVEEELRALRAEVTEQFDLLVEAELVRIFGTEDNPTVFKGLQSFLGNA